MADKNKIYYGLSQLYIAPITGNTPGSPPTYANPIAVPGAVSFSQNAESEESVFYADNRKYWTAYADNGYTGNLEIANLPHEVYEELFGWYVDAHGGLVEVENGPTKAFALLGQFEGDAHAGRWVLYNCTAGKPSYDSSSVNAEGITPLTLSIPYSATSIDSGEGYMITKYTAFDGAEESTHTMYQGWFDQVTLPGLKKEDDQ